MTAANNNTASKVVSLHGSTPINLHNELVMAQLARMCATVNELNERGMTVISVTISRLSGTPDVQIDVPDADTHAQSAVYRVSGGITGEKIMQAKIHGCRVLWVTRRIRA